MPNISSCNLRLARNAIENNNFGSKNKYFSENNLCIINELESSTRENVKPLMNTISLNASLKLKGEITFSSKKKK